MYKLRMKLCDMHGGWHGYTAYDVETGREIFIPKADVSKYEFSNASVTLSGCVRANRNVKIPKWNFRVYYQASATEAPEVSLTQKVSDFGVGLSVNTAEDFARYSIADKASGRLNKLLVDLDLLSIYTFKNTALWAIFVGINRGYLKVDSYPKVIGFLQLLDTYDIIRGTVSDDFATYMVEQFLQGNITDRAMAEVIKQSGLGTQMLFKTKKACDSIVVAGSYEIEDIAGVLRNKSQKIAEIKALTDKLGIEYKDRGMYIDACLKRFA